MSKQQVKHTFYCPPDCFAADGRVVFPRNEAHHAMHVLRLKVGDEVQVTDGMGGLFRVEMEAVTKKQAVGRTLETVSSATEPPIRLRIVLGMLKQTARYETFLEKAVELGVDSIVPLMSERTERSKLRMDRCRNILVAALKQSGRCCLPVLEEPASFSNIVEGLTEDVVGLIAHEVGSDTDHLRHVCQALRDAGELSRNTASPVGRHITLLIGPEGGFSEEEVRQAREAGWNAVWMGPRRLRAETAAMAAAGFIIMSLE